MRVIKDRLTRADLMARELLSLYILRSRSLEDATHEVLGTSRKHLPKSLRRAIYRRLDDEAKTKALLRTLVKKEEARTPVTSRTTRGAFGLIHQTFSVTDEQRLGSVGGNKIRSYLGKVTGGNIVPGRCYQVIKNSTTIVNGEKLTRVFGDPKHGGHVTYCFDEVDKQFHDLDALIFIEVNPPKEPEFVIGEELKFGKEFDNRENLERLVDGAQYEVRQPKNMINDNRYVDKGSNHIDDGGCVVIFFKDGTKVDSFFGDITLRAVSRD